MTTVTGVPIALLLPACAAVTTSGQKAIATAVVVECSAYFSWQTLGGCRVTLTWGAGGPLLRLPPPTCPPPLPNAVLTPPRPTPPSQACFTATVAPGSPGRSPAS